MRFEPPLIEGTLLRRYKRFLADIQPAEGEPFTVHCPNTGAMLGCDTPGATAWYIDSGNPKRKYRHSLEAVQTEFGMAGIHSARANALVAEAITEGTLAPLADAGPARREVAIPEFVEQSGRFDFAFGPNDGSSLDAVMEVKSVTYAASDGWGYFPDAVSSRGAKHLRALARCSQSGLRSILMFCVQHQGIERVAPAAHIDPAYAQALQEAVAAGVEVYACAVSLTRDEFRVTGERPVILEPQID